jgi:hypothetical protein
MGNLINKLMGKLGYMPTKTCTNMVSVLTGIIDQSRRHAQEDLSAANEQIRKLREEMRDTKRLQDRIDHGLNVLHFSRFIAISRDSEGTPIIRKVTEDHISTAIDMADCYEDESQYFYLDDDGKLYPVSFGGVDRHVSAGELDEFYAENPTIIFSRSGAMRANGKTVGYVQYTDH